MSTLITTLVSVLAIACLAWITIELWRIQRLIASERFTATLRKWFFAFLIFTVLRAIGAASDWYWDFDVRWFTAISFFIMHGFIIASLVEQRHVIERSEIDTITGKRRISSKMEDVLIEMKGREIELRRLFFWR